jgi:PPOX class probable F420-dependent enzyme
VATHSQLHERIPESHLDILESKCTAVCCTLRREGMLSANPVSIHWDGEFVRFSTLKDRVKYRNLLADPRIALCITHPEDALHYIEIRGRASVEEDLDRSFVNRIAKKYMDVDEYPFDPPGAERVTVTVHPEQISTPLMGRLARRK